MAAATPMLGGMTGQNEHGDSAIVVTVTPAEWITVTEATMKLGVTRRTVRRWIAENRVVSRLEEQDGREVRLIRGDTLPAVSGDVQGDDPGDSTRDEHGDALSPGPAAFTRDDIGDDHRDSTGDDTDDPLRELVTHQAEEIGFLRAQLEQRAEELRRRDAAEAELRRLLLVSQQALTAAIERPMLPPAIEPEAPRRVKWWRKLWGTNP